MKIFNHNNPRHVQILKEELNRAKRLILENMYSADEIWNKMSPNDRKSALYVAKTLNPNKLISMSWDKIPADVQDLIDLSDYELAIQNRGGQTMIRGIEFALNDSPDARSFVNQFLQKVGRPSLKDITLDQSYKLNAAVWNYIASKAQKSQSQSMMSGETIPSRNPLYKGGASWTGD